MSAAHVLGFLNLFLIGLIIMGRCVSLLALVVRGAPAAVRVVGAAGTRSVRFVIANIVVQTARIIVRDVIALALVVRGAPAAVLVVGAAGTRSVRFVIAYTVVYSACKIARIIVRGVIALQFAPLRSERTEGGELLDRRTERLCNAGVLRRDLVHALEHLAPAVVVVLVALGGIDIALHVISEHRVHYSDGDEHAEHEQAREDDRDNGAALPALVIAHGGHHAEGGPQ